VTPASKIRTIFWDIGGVLLTNGWDKDQRARVLGRLGVDIADYESRHDDANYYWERGLSTAEHFFNQTVFTEPRPFTFEQLWMQVCAESKILHPDCFDILGTLTAERRFTLATLNNESRELNVHRLDAFRLRPYFDFFICSSYVHGMKPDSAIYRFAIDVSGFEAERALFIDDKIENCEAAMTLGMQAIHFESPAQLQGRLAQLGIQAA
jgi:FMN phosphatase YigB (HAD superfamily)